jgi:hypothetical protein
MAPQPLSYTYCTRDASPDVTTPTPVHLAHWDQLTHVRLRELHLSGGVDLSTFTGLTNFNAWLALTSHGLRVGEASAAAPQGHYHVELTDEGTVAITATLTCKNDLNGLAVEILELVRPLHEPQH